MSRCVPVGPARLLIVPLSLSAGPGSDDELRRCPGLCTCYYICSPLPPGLLFPRRAATFAHLLRGFAHFTFGDACHDHATHTARCPDPGKPSPPPGSAFPP